MHAILEMETYAIQDFTAVLQTILRSQIPKD